MKRKLLSFCLFILGVNLLHGQCVPTCSNYAVSAITYTTFPSGGTNVIPTFSPNMDDGITPLIPIGFNFNFYCTTYTNLWICSNGFLQFNNGIPAVSTGFADPTQSFPSSVAPDGMVALNMCDLDPGVGGSVTFTTIGVPPNQMFILTYSNVPIYAYSSSLNTGQIVLYEGTNIIEIYTGTVTNNSTTNGTQGIESANGSLGAAVPGRNNTLWSSSNTAYQFAPFTPAPPTSVTGNTTMCQGESAYYQATYMTGASSYAWSFPSGWTGTSTLSSITATSGASGNLSVTATYTCGTSAPATLAINVNPAPVVSIVSATPNILCSGSTITFSTSGATTYTLMPGGINGTPPFTDIASVSTTYTLTGTDANGCVSVNNPTTFITVNETPVVSVNSGSVCLGQSFIMTPTGASTYVYSSLFANVTPTSAGVYSYSVTGTGTNGCVSVPAVSNLTVQALPTVTTASSRSVMCLKEKVTLTAGGASTYTWNTNATTNTISVGPSTTTSYSVVGKDAGGCVNSSSITVTVLSCVGMEEQNSELASVHIFPNPSNGIFQISLAEVSSNTQLEIYNSIGKLIMKETLSHEITSIDLQDYTNGFYFIKIKDPYGERTIKVIKH